MPVHLGLSVGSASLVRGGAGQGCVCELVPPPCPAAPSTCPSREFSARRMQQLLPGGTGVKAVLGGQEDESEHFQEILNVLPGPHSACF